MNQKCDGNRYKTTEIRSYTMNANKIRERYCIQRLLYILYLVKNALNLNLKGISCRVEWFVCYKPKKAYYDFLLRRLKTISSTAI